VTVSELVLNPYDYDFHEDPYPYYKRLRDEAPLYRNDELKFWALSRHGDVLQGFRNSTELSNSLGVSLDPISRTPDAHKVMSFLALDDPAHLRLRTLVSKGFTPRRIRELEPRVTEIFEFIKEDLLRSGYFDALAAGVVLTGGATAMDGVSEIAEQVLELPVRRGSPIRIGGLVDVVRSPAYATGVGLVMFGAEQGKSLPLPMRDERPGMFKRAWNRIAEIF